MIANDERNLKAVDSRRVAKDHPPKKKGGKGKCRRYFRNTESCDKPSNGARYTKEGFRFPFSFGCRGPALRCSPFLWLRKVGTTLQLWLLSQSTDSGASVLVAHSVAPHTRRNLPDPGWNPDPLH